MSGRRHLLGVLIGVLLAASLNASEWPLRCSDGRVDTIIDGFESITPWTLCCTDRDLPKVTLALTGGCAGQALSIAWDLNGGDWLVLLRDFAPSLDLTPYTHLRVAFRGTNPRARQNLQIKLVDGAGHIFWVVAESTTDLPVWRPMYVDLREFTCFGDCSGSSQLDLSDIRQLQVGIARCIRNGVDCESTEQAGGLLMDELAAVDLRPGAAQRLPPAEPAAVTPDPDLRASAAAAILARQRSDGLVPAWFDEATPNFNSYALALALLVFVDEWQRTGNTAYRTAANLLGSKLIELQVPASAHNDGAWFTAYAEGGGSLDATCNGNEEATPDVDRCSWTGNVGWTVLALTHLRAAGIYDPPTALQTSIHRGADWMIRQIGRIPAYPDLVTEGLEGNLSTWLGLLAARRFDEAERLAGSIYRYGWDPIEQRMKMGVRANDLGTAMDTAGSWGVRFLRHIGREAEASLSQAFAASILRTSSFDGTIEAYGDIAGPWTVATEFIGQGAAAGIRDGQLAMSGTVPLRHTNGAFQGSADNWYGGTVAPWTTTMTGVPPTAWFYFAQNRDPMTYVPPVRPSGLDATAVSGGQIDLSWNPVSGASSYQVDRKIHGGTFEQIAATPSNSFSDTAPEIQDAACLFRVRAVNDVGESADSTLDLATAILFDDDPLVPGGTVKSTHLLQLRTATNAVRDLAGLGNATFTDSAFAGTSIRGVHLTEIRSALDEALSALTLPAGGYTDSSLAGLAIKAVHFQEIRDRLR